MNEALTKINGSNFRVGGVDYTVEIAPEIHRRYSLYGQVTYKDTHIQIDDGLSPTRTNECVIHELLHAVFFEAGYIDQEEDMINRLANVLHGMLRDNDFGFVREVGADVK